jgi:hypothetical protein
MYLIIIVCTLPKHTMDPIDGMGVLHLSGLWIVKEVI